jgi:hypothetical protein
MNQNRNYFKEEPAEKDRDPDRVALENLFQPLAAKYGEQAMLHYIDKDVEVAPVVIQEWLAGRRKPSPGICNAVFSSLRNFQPENMPPEAKPVKPPMAVPGSNVDKRKQPIRKQTPAQTRKEQVITKNQEELDAMMKRLRDKGQIT